MSNFKLKVAIASNIYNRKEVILIKQNLNNLRLDSIKIGTVKA